MDRWSRILKVPLYPNSKAYYRIAVSLCLSSTSKRLITPSANIIFFNGDRVEDSGNPVIERLSNPQYVAEIQVLKFGGSVNVWVIEASTFNGPFAVYKDFIPSISSRGDPKSYDPSGFPASKSTFTLLSHCLREAKRIIAGRQDEQQQDVKISSCLYLPKTIILGFSKGGIVLNQLVTELGFTRNIDCVNMHEEDGLIPCSRESFLDSIREIHYVDVGLNSKGVYITDDDIIKRISNRLTLGDEVIWFYLHGTPRQWCDDRRVWIKQEKDELIQIIQSEAHKSDGKVEVSEKFYFADEPPSMQMHFGIIEQLDVR